MTAAPIPPVAHFIWFGREFVWVHLLAIRSAALRGEFSRVVLHHADDLSASPWWNELQAVPRFEARRLDPAALLEAAGGPPLVEVFRELEEMAGRANVVRAALLLTQGGTYLDADTVTVKSFAPLLAPGGAFCGKEHIVKPYGALSNPTLGSRAAMLIRRLARSACRELPGGWRTFRRIEGMYPAAVNNAVLGAEPKHRFIAELIESMIALPRERRRIRYSLGTHLLQQQVDRYAGGDLRVLEPRVFYPLGPEISLHWFRRVNQPALAEVVGAETRLVHWYASVRTREIAKLITPDYVRAHAPTQLFSALALPFVAG
jgi:hypothetical protein